MPLGAGEFVGPVTGAEEQAPWLWRYSAPPRVRRRASFGEPRRQLGGRLPLELLAAGTPRRTAEADDQTVHPLERHQVAREQAQREAPPTRPSELSRRRYRPAMNAGDM